MTPDGKTGLRAAKHPKPESTFDDHTSTRQSALRVIMGLHNNEDMFLDETRAFLKHYVRSQIAEDQITACIEGMLNDPEALIEKTSDDSLVFKAFSDGLTSSAHFGRIVEQIIEHNPAHPPAALHVRLCPAHWVTSNVEKGMYKIDALFTEIAQQNEIPNHHIMLPIVLAQDKTDKSRIEVHQHILGACHHILNEDVRRMWIFGITVEDSFVSLWYFSRSHSVKTFAADWLKDPRLLVQIVLTFANADYHSLGIDPSVHIGPISGDGKTLSYVYEVPSEVAGGSPTFYKTGQIGSPAPPLNIVGRGTKVWEVTQVTSPSGEVEVNPGKRVILKDVWLDEGQPTEGENLDRIFEAVDTFVSNALEAQIRMDIQQFPHLTRDIVLSKPRLLWKVLGKAVATHEMFIEFDSKAKDRLVDNLVNKKYRSLFLSKVYEWKGRVCLKVRPEARPCKTLFPVDPSLTNSTTTRTIARVSSNRTLKAVLAKSVLQKYDQATPKQHEDAARRFVPKQQVRIVYEEVCQSLLELPTLGDVMDVLCEAIDACHILFCAGWVHRDISAANILALKSSPYQTWQVKLADLELASPMIEKQRTIGSDPRTGTAFFMPVEILHRQYIFSGYFKGDFNPDVPSEDKYSDKDNDDGPADALPAPNDGSDSDIDFYTVPADPVRRNASAGRKRVSKLSDQFGLKLEDPHYDTLKDYGFVPFLPSLNEIPHDANVGAIDPEHHFVNHNFQHDLESIWWILLWFITMHVKWQPSSAFAKPFFQHDVDNYSARHTYLTAFMAHPIKEHLRPELAEFRVPLNTLRILMNQEYIWRGLFGLMDRPGSYSTIHSEFDKIFREVASQGGSWRLLEIDIEQQPAVVEVIIADSPVKAGTKHGRDEVSLEAQREETATATGTKKKKKRNNK